MDERADTRTIAQLGSDTVELVRGVADSGTPLVITHDGEAKAVLLDIHAYDRWRKAIAAVKLLEQGRSDLAEGRVVSQEEALRREREAVERVGFDA